MSSFSPLFLAVVFYPFSANTPVPSTLRTPLLRSVDNVLQQEYSYRGSRGECV